MSGETNEDFIIEDLERERDQLRAENERLMEEIKQSNSLLRSAFMIAKRDGKETNWEAFRGQLDIALERQHKMMYRDAEQALKGGE